MKNQILDEITTSEKDEAIAKSFKYLKGVIFLISILILIIVILTSGRITFEFSRGGQLIYQLMFLSIILIPIGSLVGSIYGFKAIRDKEVLSNKDTWIVFGNFVILFLFIFLIGGTYLMLVNTNFG